jgi:hypothetical protein
MSDSCSLEDRGAKKKVSTESDAKQIEPKDKESNPG